MTVTLTLRRLERVIEGVEPQMRRVKWMKRMFGSRHFLPKGKLWERRFWRRPAHGGGGGGSGQSRVGVTGCSGNSRCWPVGEGKERRVARWRGDNPSGGDNGRQPGRYVPPERSLGMCGVFLAITLITNNWWLRIRPLIAYSLCKWISLSLISMNVGAPSTTGAVPMVAASYRKLRPSPKSSAETGKSAANDGDETKGVTGCPVGMAVELPSMTSVGRFGADPPLLPSTSTNLANNFRAPRDTTLLTLILNLSSIHSYPPSTTSPPRLCNSLASLCYVAPPPRWAPLLLCPPLLCRAPLLLVPPLIPNLQVMLKSLRWSSDSHL
ncbi:hypothetical protein Ahy_B01g052092 isoform A [Arachis hypogaea]|uniref:Uncharacterized protein n=1 Tax=Arachis hypogaea TaxID=3818 RepID=A0A445ANI5_ARAHY|nr:hypothetical protein Ahy_B01g052092 isoform A [Arachis hypogaea]